MTIRIEIKMHCDACLGVVLWRHYDNVVKRSTLKRAFQDVGGRIIKTSTFPAEWLYLCRECAKLQSE